jgi:hypothetical protein
VSRWFWWDLTGQVVSWCDSDGLRQVVSSLGRVRLGQVGSWSSSSGSCVKLGLVGIVWVLCERGGVVLGLGRRLLVTGWLLCSWALGFIVRANRSRTKSVALFAIGAHSGYRGGVFVVYYVVHTGSVLIPDNRFFER